MKDIDYLQTVLPTIRESLENDSIEGKITTIILFPILMVTLSKEPLKIKILLGIIALIIFPFYLGFLIFTLPFLLLASLVLELHPLRIRTVVSFFPKLLLIIFAMFVISGIGLGTSLVIVNNDYTGLPMDLDNGNWNRTSELFVKVQQAFIIIQAVTALAMIGFFIVAFYLVFLHKKEYPYLIEEEKENLVMFFNKSFFYIPIYLTYMLIPVRLAYLDLGVERTTQFYNYYMELFYLVWLVFGFAVFYGIFLVIRWNMNRKKRSEEEVKPVEESPVISYEEVEEVEEVEELEKEETEKEFNEEVEQKAEGLVKKELKHDEDIEKRAEDLIEEEMEEEEDKDN
jgi:hypothetical protein